MKTHKALHLFVLYFLMASFGISFTVAMDEARLPAVDDPTLAVKEEQSLSAVEESPLFATHEVLDLSLYIDFDSLCRPREVDDCQYTPTKLVYKTAGGEEHSMSVKVQIRGGWRSRKDHCTVPPLFVRFDKVEIKGTPFSGQDMLPLTTHCKSKRDRKTGSAKGSDYEQYVLKEYLGYRLFNTLDDKSLRVRLLRMSYQNSEEVSEPVIRYAFFTEHFDVMAARHRATRLPQKSFDHEKIDLKAFDQVALFNYMIGNTDTSVVRQRNIVLVEGADGQQYPVPFDLDMAGLVDAEYAGVSPRLSFRDVKERLYLGYCHPEINFDALFTHFLSQKNAILALPGEIHGMSYLSQKISRAYLKRFFAVLESRKRRQKLIVDACLSWPPSPDDHTTPP
jgi:hypothetical protein